MPPRKKRKPERTPENKEIVPPENKASHPQGDSKAGELELVRALDDPGPVDEEDDTPVDDDDAVS